MQALIVGMLMVIAGAAVLLAGYRVAGGPRGAAALPISRRVSTRAHVIKHVAEMALEALAAAIIDSGIHEFGAAVGSGHAEPPPGSAVRGSSHAGPGREDSQRPTEESEDLPAVTSIAATTLEVLDLTCGCRYVRELDRWRLAWWALGCSRHPLWEQARVEAFPDVSADQRNGAA